MTKKQAAFDLYLAGYKQGDISKIIDISEATIVTWKKKDDWERQRTLRNLHTRTAKEGIMAIIQHNLKVISTNIADQELSGDLKLIPSGDIDALKKLFSAIGQEEAQWSHYVSVVREVLQYVGDVDVELAKKLTPYTDAFLQQKRDSI